MTWSPTTIARIEALHRAGRSSATMLAERQGERQEHDTALKRSQEDLDAALEEYFPTGDAPRDDHEDEEGTQTRKAAAREALSIADPESQKRLTKLRRDCKRRYAKWKEAADDCRRLQHDVKQCAESIDALIDDAMEGRGLFEGLDDKQLRGDAWRKVPASDLFEKPAHNKAFALLAVKSLGDLAEARDSGALENAVKSGDVLEKDRDEMLSRLVQVSNAAEAMSLTKPPRKGKK